MGSGAGRKRKTSKADNEEKPKRQKKVKNSAKREKKHLYGLTPGVTPFPTHVSPTPEQAEEVFNLLAKLHEYKDVYHPKVVPQPSLEVAGCGEVPCILDALLRTVLSASTTFNHANNMLKALVANYGVLESGIGKGSVNWDKVRRASFQDVLTTLKVGGLAGIKTKHVKGILDAVYERNNARRAHPTPNAPQAEKSQGAESQEDATKVNESRADESTASPAIPSDSELLTLNYMHGMSHDEAIDHFLEFPGVGVKTASCVVLFSLQIPSFAVDTHVFRFCQWLRWVPEGCKNRDKVFMHCQVRVPDTLKYGLHQLFIRHGQTCHRCGASTAPGTKEWEKSVCPLEQLLDRTIASKGANKKKADLKGPKKVKGVKKENVYETDEDEVDQEGGEATEVDIDE
ncbi:DNA glycosylase [Zalerion maritima]|uniref:DNA glycosylase n=1 Tax=Zalerion maritima TaxID=339359 RepID=A0AAD5RQG1_9PEZI|nr:DNA glycosylase [Zalerion maritima]